MHRSILFFHHFSNWLFLKVIFVKLCGDHSLIITSTFFIFKIVINILISTFLKRRFYILISLINFLIDYNLNKTNNSKKEYNTKNN